MNRIALNDVENLKKHDRISVTYLNRSGEQVTKNTRYYDTDTENELILVYAPIKRKTAWEIPLGSECVIRKFEVLYMVTCPKCKGKGNVNGYENIQNGICFMCSGTGKVPETKVKQRYSMSIIDNEGNRIRWTNVEAKSEIEAIKKAKKIALRGIYKENIDTIIATKSE